MIIEKCTIVKLKFEKKQQGKRRLFLQKNDCQQENSKWKKNMEEGRVPSSLLHQTCYSNLSSVKPSSFFY